MGRIMSLMLLMVVIGCNQSNNSSELKNRIDTLEKRLSETYKPGLGEFMSGIQIHHAKLWFAGQEQNWKLADFEIHEIMEALDNIKQFNQDRPEEKSIGMIDAPLDSLNYAIEKKDLQLFKTKFVALTNTCNNCHQATEHEFNVIKIPDAPPFSNQEFKLKENKK